METMCNFLGVLQIRHPNFSTFPSLPTVCTAFYAKKEPVSTLIRTTNNVGFQEVGRTVQSAGIIFLSMSTTNFTSGHGDIFLKRTSTKNCVFSAKSPRVGFFGAFSAQTVAFTAVNRENVQA